MRGGGKRHDRPADHLRPAACRQADVRFAGIALAHFQKASAEIGPRDDVVGPQRKHTPIGIGRGGIFAIQEHDLGQPGQNIGPARRHGESLQNKARALARSLRLSRSSARSFCRSMASGVSARPLSSTATASSSFPVLAS